MDQAKEIVGHMMKNDAFSQWLGITVVSNAPSKSFSEVFEKVIVKVYNVPIGAKVFRRR